MPNPFCYSRFEAYRDCFMLFCGKLPPIKIPQDIESLRDLPDEVYEKLQSWLVQNLQCQWMTGIGTLEAFDTMVGEAENNGNLQGRFRLGFQK